VEAVRATLGLCRDEVFAAALSMSKATVYRLTLKGLPTIKVGRKRWIDPAAAAVWLAANARPAPGRPRGARDAVPRTRRKVARVPVVAASAAE
jgi:hypothetical protein